MKPRKDDIVTELVSSYYPDIAAMQARVDAGAMPEPVVCRYPAIYLLTRTDKSYTAYAVDPAQTTIVNGKEVEQPATKVYATSANVFPARYMCVQCAASYDSLREFRHHINDSVNRAAATNPQGSLL